jgi:hypothetical protein
MIGPGRKSVDVNVQDQTTPPIEHWLSFEKESVTIQQNINVLENTIVLNAGAGSAITGIESNGYFIEIRYDDSNNGIVRFFQAEILTYTDNITDVEITVDIPLDFDLDISNVESVYIVDVNFIRVSTTALITDRKKMRVFPPNGLKWDLTRLMVTAVLTSSPDDGKFMGAAALTNGIFFGFEGDNTRLYLVNIKANAGFRATAYDVVYTSRTLPQGSYGLSVRKTFAGQDKYGVAIRLDGSLNDTFVMYLQESFFVADEDARIKVMGHIVED